MALVQVLACSGAACGGTIFHPPGDDGGKRDGRIAPSEAGHLPDGPAKGDGLTRIDLTANPGDPCTYGQCGANLICMANTCLKMCDQPMPGCNDKVATCGANGACMGASSFTDACYPATAQYGQPCDVTTALFCVGGSLCVAVTAGGVTRPPKCLKLCKYGCPTGVTCGKTNNGCDVCLE